MQFWSDILLENLFPEANGYSALRFKADFQSILCTLESLFGFFVEFVSCKTSQNVNILQLLTSSKFKVSKQPP